MRLLMKLCVVALATVLTACNTVKGMGQDLQKAGATIEDAAKKK